MEKIKYYTNLKKSTKKLVDVLANEAAFSDIPITWQVVVVDVKNSTKAVDEGRHHEINLTATGAIISVLNTIRQENEDIEIPYFFGGDGATFIIPQILLKKVIAVLENYSLHIKKNATLTLRVGHISIENLLAQNYGLKIAKHQLTKELAIPIVLGNGLKKAEEIIKSTFIEVDVIHFKKELLNLEGMECRWKEINPIQNKKKVICLLLEVRQEKNQRALYRSILIQMDALFGTFKNRQPIKPKKLKLNFSLLKIWEEMKISVSEKNTVYLLKNWIKTLIGKWYFKRTKSGKLYLNQVALLSHTFMLDGMINTVFTAEQSKIKLFTTYLDKLEKEGEITYGIHVTHASIMSCYVLDRQTKHAHFVDGTEGGYTTAAKMFKTKAKAQTAGNTIH